MKTLRKYDKGISIRLRVKDDDGNIVDLSAATVEFNFYKPDRTVSTVTATNINDGTDGIVGYTTVDGFIDQVGIWEFEAEVTIGTSLLTSTKAKFLVQPTRG